MFSLWAYDENAVNHGHRLVGEYRTRRDAEREAERLALQRWFVEWCGY